MNMEIPDDLFHGLLGPMGHSQVFGTKGPTTHHQYSVLAEGLLCCHGCGSDGSWQYGVTMGFLVMEIHADLIHGLIGSMGQL